MPWALTPTSRRVRGTGRRRDADQPIHLLRRDVGDRGSALDRVARPDRDLAAKRALPLDDTLRNALGEGFDDEGLTDHDLVDRLVDDLLEPRHVHALLARIEVDMALHLGVEQPLIAAMA